MRDRSDDADLSDSVLEGEPPRRLARRVLRQLLQREKRV